MSQESVPTALVAEYKAEETRGFMRQVRHVARCKFTAEEKIRIVLEGFQHKVPIRGLCRREGIQPNVYYAWLKEFMEADKNRLVLETVRDATKAEVDAIKRENERLKQLVA